MKIYVMSKGRFFDGNRGWVTSKDRAFEFRSYYGNDHSGVLMATSKVNTLRLRGPTSDAHIARFFD